jgi:hypothetical protein
MITVQPYNFQGQSLCYNCKIVISVTLEIPLPNFFIFFLNELDSNVGNKTTWLG